MELLPYLPQLFLFLTTLVLAVITLHEISSKDELIRELERKSYEERKDLYDRLMSADFSEYKTHVVQDEPTVITDQDQEIVPIEEARGEITGEGEENE